jgi:hypothetical protein
LELRSPECCAGDETCARLLSAMSNPNGMLRSGTLEINADTNGGLGPLTAGALFPDGNPETASIRQTALVVAPTVGTIKEFLEELRAVITQPELLGSQGNSVRIMRLYKSKRPDRAPGRGDVLRSAQ